jgi:hypothetical protein
MDRLAAITAPRLAELAERTFVGKVPTLAAIGPVGQLASIEEIGAQLAGGTAAPGLRAAAHH